MNVELAILLSDLTLKGQKYLTGAYAIGKGYAAAKSGEEIGASPADYAHAANAVDFNTTRMRKLIDDMETEIRRLDPAYYASTDDYMAAVNGVFDRYEARTHAITMYAEEPFMAGFVQGGKEAQDGLAKKLLVSSDEVGFIWRTVGDERVCPICLDLDGTWFPLEQNVAGGWSGHPG